MSDESNVLSPRDEERLAAYLNGRIGADERAEFEREILARPELAEAVYEGVAIGAMFEEARAEVADVVPIGAAREAAPRREGARGPVRWARLALPIAAALALAILTPRVLRELDRGGDSTPERYRLRSSAGAPRSTASGPDGQRCLTPRGELTAPPTVFVWTREPAAASYRLLILDVANGILASRVTADTMFEFAADDVAWERDRVSAWRVVPLDARGGELAPSEIAPIRVVPRGATPPSANPQPR
ncbi:MAG: hypothetical protein ACKVU1_05605 [bacterium]